MRYRTLEPRLDIVLRTSGVRAVGEKMARAPDWRRTIFFFFLVILCCCVVSRCWSLAKKREEMRGRGRGQ